MMQMAAVMPARKVDCVVTSDTGLRDKTQMMAAVVIMITMMADEELMGGLLMMPSCLELMVAQTTMTTSEARKMSRLGMALGAGLKSGAAAAALWLTRPFASRSW